MIVNMSVRAAAALHVAFESISNIGLLEKRHLEVGAELHNALVIAGAKWDQRKMGWELGDISPDHEVEVDLTSYQAVSGRQMCSFLVQRPWSKVDTSQGLAEALKALDVSLDGIDIKVV